MEIIWDSVSGNILVNIDNISGNSQDTDINVYEFHTKKDKTLKYKCNCDAA